MNFLQFDASQLVSYFLVLTRITGVLFLAPVLGSRNLPPQLKIGFSIFIAIALTPLVQPVHVSEDLGLLQLLIWLAREFTIGAIIGFAATLIFTGFLIAGHIIDFQMGFGMVNVIDPLTNISVSVMGQFQNLLAILVFLAINGHHYLLTALASSFDIVPLGSFALTTSIGTSFINLVTEVFVIALKIGAPAIGVILVTDIALGIIARTVTQMNVFIVAMPLKIAVGLVTMIAMLSFFVAYMLHMYEQLPGQLLGTIR